MSSIASRAIDRCALTVPDAGRSRNSCTGLLEFQAAMELGPRYVLSKGSIVMAIGPTPEQAFAGDRFHENRAGLDHISLSVASRTDFDEAAALFDEQGVPGGEIKDWGSVCWRFATPTISRSS
jgi:glyoxylase I family protein